MSLPTQAAIVRAVQAALAPAIKAGLPVRGYKVSFVQGIPCVDVTLGAESPLPASVSPGGGNVEELKERVARLHARRS